MSSLITAELLATCNSLGCFDGDTYYKEDDCLDSIKDLILFLKRDDNSCEIRRQLGETKVLQTDLVHILKAYKDDEELLNVTLRLLVNLTMPALIVFEEKIPEEKVGRRHYLEVIGHLQEYKVAFCDDRLLQVLSDKLRGLLKLDWEHRQEDDQMLMEWILILIRNVLHIPPNPAAEQRTDDDASIHDRVLWGLHKSGLEDLLLFIANSENYHEFCLHALEIITLMLREQTPKQLAQAGASRAQSEKQKDDEHLMNVRQREEMQRVAAIKKQHYASRHTRFGGTYCVTGVKSISDRELIVHRPIASPADVNFDANKKKCKKPKNLLAVETADVTRRSTLSIRLFLRDFCVEFLNSVYNSIMYIVKDQLARQRTQDHDETYYLWAIKFFMEFNRHYDFRVELVSETMSVATLHYIQTQLDTYQEMLISDKKKIPLWTRRIHLGLNAYQELVMSLAAMDCSTDAKVRESSRVLKTNIFYMVEYRELPYLLLHNYKEATMTKAYLKDLVEMTHVFLKMLEKQSTGHRHLVVEEKKRVKNAARKKPAKAPAGSQRESQTLSEDQLDALWNEMALDVSAAVQGNVHLPEHVSPFDAASDVPVDEQRTDGMRRLQGFLRSKKVPEAVAFFRAAREVWPQDDCFGASDILPEDELMALREICLTTLAGGPIFENAPAVANAPGEDQEGQYPAVDGPPEDPEDDEDNEELAEVNADIAARTEKEFEFKKFVARFASAKIIQAYALLLHQYEKNSDFTNHCVVKMFHRLSFDCGFTPVLFQASIFRDLQRLMEDPISSTNGTLKEIAKFSKYLLRKFFEVAAKNKKVFIELLFWKNSKDAYDIEEGYGASKEQSKGGAHKIWSEEEEAELQTLFAEYKDQVEEGKDTVDLIMENFSDSTKTRRQIIGQLKRQNLVSNIKELKLKKPSNKSGECKIPRDFSEDEVAELRDLFTQFKDAEDIVGRILDGLTIKRPKHRVVSKLLELGVVQNKAELRRKRTKKTGQKSASEKSKKKQSMDSEDSSEDDEQSSGSDTRGQQSTQKQSSLSKALQNRQRRKKRNNYQGDDENSASDEDECSPQEFLNTFQEAISVPELNGPISWVRDDLKDIAADRENEDDLDAVPLVPIMEENHVALENPIFVRLLKAIGIEPPANEQESFWRYPARLTATRCHQRADVLSKGLDGTLDFSAVLSTLPESKRPSKLPKSIERAPLKRDDSTDSSSDEDVPLSLSARPQSASSIATGQSKGGIPRKRQTKRHFVGSSSEDDREHDDASSSNSILATQERSQTPANKSVERAHPTSNVVRVTKRIVISSDEDDDEQRDKEATQMPDKFNQVISTTLDNDNSHDIHEIPLTAGNDHEKKRKLSADHYSDSEKESEVQISKKSKTFVIDSDSD